MADATRGRGTAPAPLAIIAAAAVAAMLPLPAAAATPGESGIMVTALTLATDFARSHVAYAAASRLGCTTGGCSVLLRTDDAGHSWTQVAAAGWTGQPVFAAAAAGAVTAGANHLATSSDGGAAFTDTGVPADAVDAVGAGGGALTAVVSASAGRYLVTLPGHDVRALPAPALDNATTYLDPAYPRVPGGAAAFVSGTDHRSGLPEVQRCDSSFACTGAATVGAAKDVARLYVSPHVDSDGVILAATSKAFFRSADGGRSFAPVTVVAPSGRTLITTVQDVSFSPDFDASRHTGRVLVAFISVSGTSGHAASTSGGVYSSADGSTWSHFGGPSQLDDGAAAVAAAPDGRVLAAWVGFGTGHLDGGLLCTVDGAAWTTTCAGAGGGAHAVAGGSTQQQDRSTSAAGAGAAAAAPQYDAASGAVSGTAVDRGGALAATSARHPHTGGAPALGFGAAAMGGLLAALAVMRRRRRPRPLES